MSGIKRFTRPLRITLFLTLGLIIGLLVADYFYPLVLPQQKDSFATLVVDRHGEPLRSFADKKGVWRYEIQISDVSPLYIDALINYEDQYFYDHFGINPLSLLRAGLQLLREGEVVSGGSTLTMQVARILYPHSRTVAGKVHQMLRAIQLEWYLSKAEILELYLNYAPFGGTIEGVQAASLQYLHKPASSLRPSEAALLAVLPQAPSRLRPDRHPERAELARNKVLQRMLHQGRWSDEIVVQAQQEKIAVWPLVTPQYAPILSRRLHQQYPTKRLIHTSLILSLQQQFEETVSAYVSSLDEKVSASVLLLDNESQEVVAYLGSAGFNNRERAGHVDMVSAIRSPGSTLKPFLFGLSLDKNLIHSESLLADVPRVAEHYRPGNFSLGFTGPVSAATALTRSLNLPFVQLIETYGPQSFVNKLEHVGIHLTIPGGHANPAVILGGAGISLEELVVLYSSLANGGRVRHARFLADNVQPSLSVKNSQHSGRALLSAESAWVTWQTLNDVKLPQQMRYGLRRESLPSIGWKTGTSWDYRDVWAIGVSQKYTLGVWLGRPDGKPMQKTMGSLLAAPLLFNLFGQLEKEVLSIPRPDSVTQQSICWPDGRDSNSVKKENCHHLRTAYTIDRSTPRTLNPEYKQGALLPLFYSANATYLVDPDSELRVSSDCTKQGLLRSTYLWPDRFDLWLKPERRKYNLVPGFDPRCRTIKQSSSQLRLSGVDQGQIYHRVNQNELTLNIKVSGSSGALYWYLNGELQSGNKSELTIKVAKRQQYELFVQDKMGSSGRVVFEVL
jgi:penicillin-binding protein 1C